MSRKLNDLQERLDVHTEACLFDKKIDDETYERQKQRISECQLEICRQLGLDTYEDVDLEATLSFAKNMMLHPAEFWRRINPIHKPRFQQAMYPDGIKFGDRYIGTSENSLIFSTLREPQRADVIMASPSGFEPLLPT